MANDEDRIEGAVGGGNNVPPPPPPPPVDPVDPPARGGQELDYDRHRLAAVLAQHGRAAARAFLVAVRTPADRVEAILADIRDDADAILLEAQRLADQRRRQDAGAGAVPRRIGPAGDGAGFVNVGRRNEGGEGDGDDRPPLREAGRAAVGADVGRELGKRGLLTAAFNREVYDMMDDSVVRRRPGDVVDDDDDDDEGEVITSGVETGFSYIFRQFQNIGIGNPQFDAFRESFSPENLAKMLSKVKQEELHSTESVTSYEVLTAPVLLADDDPAGFLSYRARADFLKVLKNEPFDPDKPDGITVTQYLSELRHFSNGKLNSPSVYALLKCTTAGKAHKFITLQENLQVPLAHAYSSFARLFARSMDPTKAKLALIALKAEKPTNIRDYCLRMLELIRECSFSVSQDTRKIYLVTNFRSEISEVLHRYFPFQSNDIMKRESLARTSWLMERRRIKQAGGIFDDSNSSYHPLSTYLGIISDTLENVRPVDAPYTTTLPKHISSVGYKKDGGVSAIDFDPQALEQQIEQEQALAGAAGAVGDGQVAAANFVVGGGQRNFQQERPAPAPKQDGKEVHQDRRKYDLADPRFRVCIMCGNKPAKTEPNGNNAKPAVPHDWRYCSRYPDACPGPQCGRCAMWHPSGASCPTD